MVSKHQIIPHEMFLEWRDKTFTAENRKMYTPLIW